MPTQHQAWKDAVADEFSRRVSIYIWKVVPYVGFALLWLLGNIPHILLGDNTVLWVTLLIVSTVLLTLESIMASRGGPLRVFLRATTTFFVGMWIAGAVIWGTTGFMGQIMLWGGLMTLSTAWALLSGPHDEDEDDETSRKDRFIKNFAKVKDKWGHLRTKVKKLPPTKSADGTINPHKKRYEFAVDDTEKTSEDAVGMTKRLAALNHTSPDRIIVSPDPEDFSKAVATVVSGNLEHELLPWPGPSKPGGSPEYPLMLGKRIDGEPAGMVSVDKHTQVMGMSGSGKSFGFMVTFIAELISRRSKAGRPELWGIDLAKGEQTFGPMVQAFDRIAYDDDEALALLTDLKNDIKERTNILTREGYNSWDPGSSLRYRVVVLEEAPTVFAFMEEQMDLYGNRAGELWKVARSAGVSIITSLQIATHGEQPKTVLRQISNKICFGVGQSDDVHYGLPETPIKNGADPSKWQSFKPGMCYIAAEGTIPMHEAHTPVRTYFITREQIVQHCAQHPAPGKEDWIVITDANGNLKAVPPTEDIIADDGTRVGITTEEKPEQSKVGYDPETDTVRTLEDSGLVGEEFEDEDQTLDEVFEELGMEAFDLEAKPMSVSLGGIPDEDVQTTHRRALAILEGYQRQGIKVFKIGAVAAELQVGRQSVWNVFDRLIDDKVLEKHAHGKYTFGENFGKVLT